MNAESLILFKLYIMVTPLLFIIGLFAIMTTKNIVAIIIGIEIMTKGVTLLLATSGYFSSKPELTQNFIIVMIIIEVVILTIAAGLIINIAKRYDSLSTKNIRNLKG